MRHFLVFLVLNLTVLVLSLESQTKYSSSYGKYYCRDPKGSPGEVVCLDGKITSCQCRKSRCRWAETDVSCYQNNEDTCPPRIDIDGALYRNVGVGVTPCKGDISQCIYSRFWFEYCMNGDSPYYKPQLLPIGPYENVKEKQVAGGIGYYVTTNIGTPSPFATPFNMSTIMQPVTKYDLFSANYANRKVCGGFEWFNYNNQKQPAIGTVTGTPEAEVPVAPDNYIIEVYGNVGYLLDRLTFVTMDAQNQRRTQGFTCGGIFGTSVDATPPGRCQMVNIAGTTKDVDGSQLIATMEFTWFCY